MPVRVCQICLPGPPRSVFGLLAERNALASEAFVPTVNIVYKETEFDPSCLHHVRVPIVRRVQPDQYSAWRLDRDIVSVVLENLEPQCSNVERFRSYNIPDDQGYVP